MRKIITFVVSVFMAQALMAQSALKPSAPGEAGDPRWQGVIHMTDGRTFVTDGGLAVDAAVARPSRLPARVVPGKVLETYFTATHPDECGFADLSRDPSGRTYTTPKGIPLNATYIDYLRRILAAGAVRFRLNGEMEPVLVAHDGRIAGVLMPVRK